MSGSSAIASICLGKDKNIVKAATELGGEGRSHVAPPSAERAAHFRGLDEVHGDRVEPQFYRIFVRVEFDG